MKFCQIIPDKILERLKDVKSLAISEKMRNKRKELLKLKSQALPVPAEHDEIRVLYEGHHNEDLNEADKNIIQIDKQHHETTPSTNSNLEFFNKIYDFIHDSLDRESFDNHNAIMKIFIHVGQDYNNAFWNGELLAFGDGDQQVFKTFMIQNVATHETFHAVTEYTAQLEYQDQAGALNESISDVFAVCLDQKLKNQTPAQASWIIGEGVFMPSINGKGLRSFKDELAYDDPVIGKDDQVKNMKDLYTGQEDNGGVHTNSGIPNHAFYQFCIRTGKFSWEVPMHLWYDTLLITKPKDDFKTFALNTVKIASSKLSVIDKDNLIKAWLDVGIKIKAAPNPKPDNKKKLLSISSRIHQLDTELSEIISSM